MEEHKAARGWLQGRWGPNASINFLNVEGSDFIGSETSQCDIAQLSSEGRRYTHSCLSSVFENFHLIKAVNCERSQDEFVLIVADSLWKMEPEYGRVEGVIRTLTGYCGVCEGRTGHTKAVKVIYDKTKVTFQSLCDHFWEIHDPTKKDCLNVGVDTHKRSAIFYKNESEREQARESKVRKQMRLNKRIVTQILELDSEFFEAVDQHQKVYLQKHFTICAHLGL
ncbi:uncharacterized protein LOC129288414 [Prosopis cineraria]|uniref:uncharacterized protein LOC129288414 n=1 Tax=Prosopis cineraria TaxID=364024 RepID=UPI0024101792|nr:uncharacterized protein LOC129288414 [Prosopis cineraria]